MTRAQRREEKSLATLWDVVRQMRTMMAQRMVVIYTTGYLLLWKYSCSSFSTENNCLLNNTGEPERKEICPGSKLILKEYDPIIQTTAVY